MALIVKDRVQETCNSPGTGTVSLLGAVTGFQTFSAAIGNANTTFYTIADQTGANWEVGLGTYSSSGNTLARTTVLASSNGGSLTNFSSGVQNVWGDYPAGKAVYQDAGGVVTVPVLATNSTTNVTPVLSFNASNANYAGAATISGSYLQFLLQNKSGTAGASTNYVLSNDLGTDSTYYGEFGMNSSVFSASTPADFFSLNNGVYFSGHDGDVIVGSGNGFKNYMAWGTSGQSAHVINAAGALGLSTNLGTTPALSGTTGYGTAGQVLTSQGSAAAPTWTSLTGTTITVTDFTATAAQTTFSVSYTVGLIEVYRNGVKLGIADYTATSGTSVVLASGCNAGDLVECVIFTPLNIAGSIISQDFSGNGSTTAFTMSQSPTSSASILVAIAGVLQDPANYTVSGTTLTFSTAPATGTNNISVRYLGLPSTTSVGSISFGSTGLTPSTSSTGAVTVGGVLLGAYGGTPAGAVDFFAMNTAPSGYIKANGAAVSRTTYATLFSAIGTTFGVGDGSTTFNVPDMRGYFARGWVDNGSVDSGRAFGSTQTDAFQGHKHSMDYSGPFMTPFPSGGGMSSGGGAAFVNAACGNPSTDGTNGTPRTAAETRPSNVALLACIKY